jgi:toxin ParE1/3/4
MTNHVELTARAIRDLRHIFAYVDAEHSPQAAAWFNELQTVIRSLDEHPERCPTTPENKTLRHLLFGKKPNVYRIVYSIDERAQTARVLHIRHGTRAPL